MSSSDTPKAGFELDVIDLSSLSGQKQDNESSEQPPSGAEEDAPQEQEKAPPRYVETQKPAGKSILPFLFGGIILIAAGAVLYFFLMQKESVPLPKNDNLPGQFKQSIVQLAQSIAELRGALKLVDNMSLRINSKQKILSIMDSVVEAENNLAIFKSAKQQFADNVKKFRTELGTGGDAALITAGEFYQNRTDEKFISALTDLITIQKKYLSYFHDNYEKVHAKQQPQIYTYEKYYLEYTRAIEKYDQETELMRKSFQPILQRYPDTRSLFLIRDASAIFKID